MRILLLLCLFSAFYNTVLSQKMLRSDDWCAENKRLIPNAPPSAPDQRSDSIDLIHTDIRLNLLNTPQIEAVCSIRFVTKVAGVPEIRLDLEGLSVDSIRLNGLPAGFTHTGPLLTIPFSTAPATGDTQLLEVVYHGQPLTDPGDWGGFYHQGNYTFNLGVGFVANPHSFGRAWFPCFDNFVERNTFEFHLKTNPAFPAHCNGVLTGEEQEPGQTTRHWAINQAIPSYLAGFASGPYTTWKRTLQSIPVEIAAAAADTNKVALTFKHLSEAIQCFQFWYGPFKWSKIGYSLVPFNSGAMEHATNVAIGRVFVDGSLNYETLWAHELSHHWWGDLATCSTAEDMWLNEGWAVYSEHLFTEWVYGKQAYHDAVRSNFLEVLEKAHLNEGGYRAVSGIPHEWTYGDHVYHKGAVVAHNLRGYLGDSLFRTGILSALAETNFDDWNSAELKDKINAATGQDLDDFFNDWVFNPGFTHFSIDSVTAIPGPDSVHTFQIFVKQKLRGAPHFYQKVPLEFTFIDAGWQRITRPAIVSGETDNVILDVPAQFTPLFVWVNTNHKLTLARAEKELVVKSIGNKNFAPAKMTINVTAIPDSALIRVEHHYVMPDTAGEANPNAYLLTNRYWSIDADLPDNFDGYATVLYDGRGQMDQLDTELFAQTGPSEDSILLLYRQSPGQPWTEYPTYSKNTLASGADKYGMFRIEHVIPGQYTIAKGSGTVSVSGAPDNRHLVHVAPNPASKFVRIDTESPFDKILIFNGKGELKRLWSGYKTQSTEIPLTDFSAGNYWLVAFTEKGVAGCRVVVTK
ncbi:MAG: hypothetical protein IPJ82_11005 [Lewinellaceae bacterium]|nr:hypothetical protein [Lewinellaceae bacterium]